MENTNEKAVEDTDETFVKVIKSEASREDAADEHAAEASSNADTHDNIDLGQRGIQAAARFLAMRGFEVLELNWTCPAGEADIIAIDDEDVLHFVEVKTRSSDHSGFPEEAVTAKKRTRYEKIAAFFLRDWDGPEGAVTFDVVSILVTGSHRAFLRMHRNVLCSVD